MALAGPLTWRSGDGDTILLIGKDGTECPFSRQTLASLLARGLLRQANGRYQATGEVRPYLRRLLIEEGEDGFQAQHRDVVEDHLPAQEGLPRRLVRRNRDESPLAQLAKLRDKSGQPYFTAEAIDAGERLAADFYRGGLQPRVTARWEPRLDTRGKGGAGGVADLTETALAARIRFARAVEAMGPDLSGVAVDVCCFTKGLELVERERLWPARSAKLMLRTALAALARHYDPPGNARRTRARHWGTADYRPEL